MNYTDRATAACRRSDYQLLRIECHVVSVTDPYGCISAQESNSGPLHL
jgi:hypothetical protein